MSDIQNISSRRYTIKPRKENGKKNVVIVGGGYGGFAAAKQLDKDYNVTLIERKKAFYHNIAAVRVPLDHTLVERAFISYDNLLKNGYVLHANVREISSTLVTLDDDQTIAFDYLIIATGTNNITPFKYCVDVDDNVPSYFKSMSDSIKQASSILIVGGGAVGVEFAGEIRDKYKEKKITILNASQHLINDKLTSKFYKRLDTLLEKNKIQVIVNDRLTAPDSINVSIRSGTLQTYNVERKVYITEKGVEIESDLIFYCIGNTVNNQTLTTHFSNVIDQQGRIKVNKSLQVEGYSNIFAIGDVNNVPELKTSFNAGFHASVVAKNIPLIEKSNDFKTPKLNEHNVAAQAMIGISFGKSDGLLQMPNGWVFGAFLMKMLKSKDLFLSRFNNKEFNSPKPFFKL
ncbi:hypothetical protein CYY_005441 [Polysphondylium violaceum]|uniref:FAD/NAD(P)-binding domain-containing protein n=1 Tax=Polysphondylium violaceum TaxID=133409 RepID=A0A8J4V6U9_9MYCE|nr:hypothetical protein CYY_005441 [Polysphondylium violaceum]